MLDKDFAGYNGETLPAFPSLPPIPLKWKTDPIFEMVWSTIWLKFQEQPVLQKPSCRLNEMYEETIRQRLISKEEVDWMAGVVDNGMSLTVSKSTETKGGGKWVYVYTKPEMRADESKYPARVIGLCRWGGSLQIIKRSGNDSGTYPSWLWRSSRDGVVEIINKIKGNLMIKAGMVPIIDSWAFAETNQEKLEAYEDYIAYTSLKPETDVKIPDNISLAYIAGWVDSGGTFSRTSKGNPLFELTARNRNLVLYMKSEFGGSATGQSLASGYASPETEIIPHFNWQISGEPAKRFLDSLREYVWIKREQIDQMKLV